MKKLLSIIAIFAMTIVSVFALSESEQIKSWNFLASKNFIKDSSSSPKDYRISDNITRKETMKIIANVAYLKTENNCVWSFKDVVDDWGCKYIEAALKAWIISKNDKFRPDDNVTKAEFLKLLFKARNLDKKYNTWVWQEDYMKSAYELWLIDDIASNYNSDAKRWRIFVAVAKTFPDYNEFLKSSFYSDEVKIK